MKYAYLDKGHILHVTEYKATAEKYSANGKIIETDIKSNLGYPAVKTGNTYTSVVAYSPFEMKKAGKYIEPVKEIAELYEKCR